MQTLNNNHSESARRIGIPRVLTRNRVLHGFLKTERATFVNGHFRQYSVGDPRHEVEKVDDKIFLNQNIHFLQEDIDKFQIDET